MFRRLRFRAPFFALAAALASCGPLGSPAPSVPGNLAGSLGAPGACYVTKQAPQRVAATITFYGWPDNTPPGKAIAHPIVHRFAAGSGTYCDPTTFATEKANNAAIPYGTKIYVPFLQQYFVREDDCAPSGPPVGHGHNGCYKLWFDLWIGGNGSSNTNAVVNCEDALTPNGKVTVVVDPKDGMPVKLPGPVYRNKPAPAGTCFGKPGNTHHPRQSTRRTIFPN
jgi:hypothetical protein